MEAETVEESLWDDKDVAAYMRVSRWTVQRMRLRGELPVFYIGAQARYAPAEVRAFFASRARLERKRTEAKQ